MIYTAQQSVKHRNARRQQQKHTVSNQLYTNKQTNKRTAERKHANKIGRREYKNAEMDEDNEQKNSVAYFCFCFCFWFVEEKKTKININDYLMLYGWAVQFVLYFQCKTM